MHACVPSLHRLNLSGLTRRGQQTGVPDDAAPCPYEDPPPPQKAKGKCLRNISTAYGRHYEVLRDDTYGVDLLRVTFDEPWGIDGQRMTRLEFFKYTRDKAQQTRQDALHGKLPHGRSIPLRAQYLVLGTVLEGIHERTWSETMLSIVPIALYDSGASRGHNTTAIGGTKSPTLNWVALAIIQEDPQDFFDLTPEKMLDFRERETARVCQGVHPGCMGPCHLGVSQSVKN